VHSMQSSSLQAETPTQTLISDLDLQLTATNIFGVKAKSQEKSRKIKESLINGFNAAYVEVSIACCHLGGRRASRNDIDLSATQPRCQP
jgi:hypothetical protein